MSAAGRPRNTIKPIPIDRHSDRLHQRLGGLNAAPPAGDPATAGLCTGKPLHAPVDLPARKGWNMQRPSGGVVVSGRLLPFHKITLKGESMAALQAADRFHLCVCSFER